MEKTNKVSIPSNGSSLFQKKASERLKNVIIESLNPLKRVKFISITDDELRARIAMYQSQSPQTGQVYFKKMAVIRAYRTSFWSQSPQTGQVYFNNSLHKNIKKDISHGLNPLKRVKFISIYAATDLINYLGGNGLNPLKRVKFISTSKTIWSAFFQACLNPLKRVKFISMHIHLGIEHKVFIVIKIAMVDRFMIGGRGYIDKFFIIVYIASNCVGDNDFGNKVCKYVIIEQFSKIA